MSDSKWFSIWGKGGFGIYSERPTRNTIGGFHMIENANTSISFKEISKTNMTINNIERKKVFGYTVNVQTEIMLTRNGRFSWQSSSGGHQYLEINEEGSLTTAKNLFYAPIWEQNNGNGGIGIFPFFDSDLSFAEQFNLSNSKLFILDTDKISIKQLDKQLEVGQALKLSYHNTIPYTKSEFEDLINRIKYFTPPLPTGTNNYYYNN